MSFRGSCNELLTFGKIPLQIFFGNTAKKSNGGNN